MKLLAANVFSDILCMFDKVCRGVNNYHESQANCSMYVYVLKEMGVLFAGYGNLEHHLWGECLPYRFGEI